MIRKFIIAAAAAGALLGTAAVSTALAETNVHVNFNLGGYSSHYPESYPVYSSYPVADEDDDEYDSSDCGYEYITVKKWNRYHDRFRIVHKREWVCN